MLLTSIIGSLIESSRIACSLVFVAKISYGFIGANLLPYHFILCFIHMACLEWCQSYKNQKGVFWQRVSPLHWSEGCCSGLCLDYFWNSNLIARTDDNYLRNPCT